MESILLITEDSAVRRPVKSWLSKAGFRVVVSDLKELKDEGFSGNRCDVVIVDSISLNSSATEAIRLLGKDMKLSDAALLLLLKEDETRLLESCQADDFLTFPCSPQLLTTRLRFLLKKTGKATGDDRVVFGDLSLDFARYEVALHGEPMGLTFKEFELLKFLVTHPERVYSRDQLLNQVWGYDYIGGTRTVDVHIRRLRAKLGPRHSSLISTVRNVGYKCLQTL